MIKIKNNKVSKIISVFMLMLLIMGSIITTVKAYETYPDIGYDFHYYHYGEDQLLNTSFQIKQSTDSMYVNCFSSSNTFSVRAIGSNDYNMNDGIVIPYDRNYEDVSNGYTYSLWSGQTNYNIYSWAYEWGYRYGGLKGYYGGDDFNAYGCFNAN